jgi:hypothetical protein
MKPSAGAVSTQVSEGSIITLQTNPFTGKDIGAHEPDGHRRRHYRL